MTQVGIVDLSIQLTDAAGCNNHGSRVSGTRSQHQVRCFSTGMKGYTQIKFICKNLDGAMKCIEVGDALTGAFNTIVLCSIQSVCGVTTCVGVVDVMIDLR